VSDTLHAPAVLPPGKEFQIAVGEMGQEPVCTYAGEKKPEA
jgi:hypothetical protein